MNSPLYRIESGPRSSRRSFLLATTSLVAASAWAQRGWGAVRRNIKLADYPFRLGVASGDPTASGVVLWTRLAPKPTEGGGMPDETVEVAWQIAEDEQMSKVVQQGTVEATPQWAHSVHVEVEGLKPDRWYWYQFQAAGEASPKARTRTTPAADVLANRARLAIASCQHLEAGHYTAYEHMLKEDLDLVIHLGDYIYEGAGRDGGVRKHIGPYLETLADYRNRHAQYKEDVALQAMHAAAPWIVTWDDHEVANNYAAHIPEHPHNAFLDKRAAAYQAYYEHMPLRRSALPNGPDMLLYRKLDFGRLADFYVLDTRQYRSDQPCDDRNEPCDEVMDPGRTMLGDKQRDWLFSGLGSASATWKVLAQQVMMARVDRAAGEKRVLSMDQWPGYEFERQRILKFLHERKIANPVVLTGDIHSNWANELITDFDNLDSACVAAEFVGTSISSGSDGLRAPKNLEGLQAENPFVKFHNIERGYVCCELSPNSWRSDYRTVEYVRKPGAPLQTRASFVVEAGRSNLNPA